MSVSRLILPAAAGLLLAPAGCTPTLADLTDFVQELARTALAAWLL